MSNLNHNEILMAPSGVMFLMFISSLLAEGKATFSEHSNQVILLNSEASNYFILGRDDKMTPFIGIQETMVPWFVELKWSKIALCPKEKYVYMIVEEEGIPVFTLGLKPRTKRMVTLVDPKLEKIDEIKINLKIFKMVDNDVAVSHNNALQDGLSVKWINSIKDIIEPEEKSEEPPEQDNLVGFNIVKRK